ncbi:hypothetical protein DITRI_Ditri08aG0067300 [Diplodiscus trichospermus]
MQAWERLENEWLKINVDCSYERKTNKAGARIIVRDHNAEAVIGRSKEIQADSAIQAEVMALREGMNVENNFWKAIFKVDSRDLYSKIVNREGDVDWRIMLIITNIQMLAPDKDGLAAPH